MAQQKLFEVLKTSSVFLKCDISRLEYLSPCESCLKLLSTKECLFCLCFCQTVRRELMDLGCEDASLAFKLKSYIRDANRFGMAFFYSS